MTGSASAQDVVLLFATRVTRLFAYGSLSVILALYLAELGLDEKQIGLLLSLTLIGDTAISLWLTTQADRFGRRRTLMIGAVLMAAAGVVFALTEDFLLLLLAATIGVISPSGNEVGPFLSVEQAALSQVVADRRRTAVFAWYTLAGSLATAVGSLGGGALVSVLQHAAVAPLTSYRFGVAGYAVMGVVLWGLFARLSAAAEVHSNAGATPPAAPRDARTVPKCSRDAISGHVEPASATSQPAVSQSRLRRLGLQRSHRVVFKLSTLFALDAFAGGFVIQSIAAYWFHVRFGVSPAVLGAIFFGANVFAGFSALVAARLAARFGLVNTMVFTHLPSNVLLILVPLMPNLELAILVLLLRFSISQMDVPTRQSYVMAVVPPEERSAAAGVTGVARTTGAAISPLIAGVLLASKATFNAPFLLAGGLKIVYDLLLYRSFVTVRPPEEKN